MHRLPTALAGILQLVVLTAPVVVALPASGATTAAFVDFDDSPVGRSLEARLLKKAGVAWVERNDVADVLRERALQALFAPAGVGERRELGRLVRADVLILLRNATSDGAVGSHKQLVVCETKQGLRLAIHSLPPTPNDEGAVARLETWIDEALGRVDRATNDVVAVPPLVSNDLGYAHDHLRRAYADLIEQTLLQHGRFAIVELAEAEALAKEQTLTAGEAKVERGLPLYLLGDYRHDGAADALRLTIHLRLMCGDQVVGVATNDRLTPADAPEYLRRTAVELLHKVDGGGGALGDANLEARQLADRARDLMALGAHDEASSLVEAALLLRPEDESLRRDAIVVGSRAIDRMYGHREDPKIALPALRGALRGLEHMELWLSGNPDIDALPRSAGNTTMFSEFQFYHLLWLARSSHNAEVQEAFEKVRPRIVEALYRMGRLRSRQNAREAYYYFTVVTNMMPTSRERYDEVGRIVLELQDLPGARARTEQLVLGGHVIGRLHEPGGMELLDRLASAGNEEVRAAAARMKAQLEADRNKPASTAPTIADTFQHEPKYPLGPVRVDLKPITITVEGRSTAPAYFDGCLPVGPGIDLFWTSRELYVMKQAGVLRQVWQTPGPNDWFQNRIGTGYHGAHVVFDGRYVWATVARHKQKPMLIVFDPQTDSVRDVTADAAFPLLSVEEMTKQNNTRQYLAVAAIEPGRACVVGWFGRSWLADVTFDAGGKHDVRLVREFRRTPDSVDPNAWRDLDAAFCPTYLITLGGSEPGGRRVLIGRRDDNYALSQHPLLFDPATGAVEPVIDELQAFESERDFAVHNGSVYFLSWIETPRELALVRIGPPTWTVERLLGPIPQGDPVAVDDRVHVIGKRWWTGALEGGGTKVDGFSITEPDVSWFYRNRWVYNNDDAKATTGLKLPADLTHFHGAYRSSHFGLIVVTAAGGRNGRKTYQPTFRPRVP